MTITSFLAACLVMTCAVSFVLTLCFKWEIIDLLEAYAPTETLAKLLHCTFCLSFWCCCILSLIAALVFFNGYLLLCPFVCTPVAKILVSAINDV